VETEIDMTPSNRFRTTVTTVTSNAYLDNAGNTIFLANPTPLNKRAVITKPSVLQGFNLADTKKICRCGNIYNIAPTMTRTIAARPTIGKLFETSF
jgi:hypothetical protein